MFPSDGEEAHHHSHPAEVVTDVSILEGFATRTKFGIRAREEEKELIQNWHALSSLRQIATDNPHMCK